MIKKIRQNWKAEIERKGIRPKELAEMMGVDTQTIYNNKNGTVKLTLEFLQLSADLAGIAYKDLFKGV